MINAEFKVFDLLEEGSLEGWMYDKVVEECRNAMLSEVNKLSMKMNRRRRCSGGNIRERCIELARRGFGYGLGEVLMGKKGTMGKFWTEAKEVCEDLFYKNAGKVLERDTEVIKGFWSCLCAKISNLEEGASLKISYKTAVVQRIDNKLKEEVIMKVNKGLHRVSMLRELVYKGENEYVDKEGNI
jgi:hypothetical protein